MKKAVLVLTAFILTGCSIKAEVDKYPSDTETLQEVAEIVEKYEAEEPVMDYHAETVIFTENPRTAEHLRDLCSDYGIDYETFAECSWNYGIEPDYAMAVFILETEHGKSDLWLHHYNPAGIKHNGTNSPEETSSGYCSFYSNQQGIEQMFITMFKLAYDYDRHTINSMRSVWSEAEDTEIIVKIMNDIRER